MSPSRSDSSAQYKALTAQINSRIWAEGNITFPAVPAMLDDFTTKCADIFASLGRPCSEAELTHLRAVLDRKLTAAYTASHRSTVTVKYRSAVGGMLNYTVHDHCQTIDEVYHHWLTIREPPLFGTEPDARVTALAAAAEDPRNFRVLDIGAGTGRNALALARRGHPVDVVEVTPKFADSIRDIAAAEALEVRVIQRDIFDTDDDLRSDYALIILAGVVPEFREPQQLHRLFQTAARCLAPGGRLVFEIFVAKDSYLPDDAARQFAQQAYSTFFTREEIAASVQGMPLTLEGDDSVYVYEKEHLPAGTWPPTGWYDGWSNGRDVFAMTREDCPIELRWLVYRRD